MLLPWAYVVFGVSLCRPCFKQRSTTVTTRFRETTSTTLVASTKRHEKSFVNKSFQLLVYCLECFLLATFWHGSKRQPPRDESGLVALHVSEVTKPRCFLRYPWPHLASGAPWFRTKTSQGVPDSRSLVEVHDVAEFSSDSEAGRFRKQKEWVWLKMRGLSKRRHHVLFLSYFLTLFSLQKLGGQFS